MQDTTRVLMLEMLDIQAEDRLSMAILKWNKEYPDTPILFRQLYSAIVGDPEQVVKG